MAMTSGAPNEPNKAAPYRKYTPLTQGASFLSGVAVSFLYASLLLHSSQRLRGYPVVTYKLHPSNFYSVLPTRPLLRPSATL